MMMLVGQKRGMTRIFSEDGKSIPVSVISVSPNRVTQIKSVAKEGYDAVQVTCGIHKVTKLNKPTKGHLAKANVEEGRNFWEFRVDDGKIFELGQTIGVDIFTQGQKVDVTGLTKGKGFAGVIKRYNFSMQDATHGNSLSHRSAGSIGQNQTPGRVFKGKKMAGHMGNSRCTTLNLEIVRIDLDRQLLLVKGAIPGAPGGDIFIRPAIKTKNTKA
ncbi:MAG: 50S ribosomal protein L3 [Proteobacteria bacterium]|nr:50S ribosomal protein L3 [Pseudomonadota bacterium]